MPPKAAKEFQIKDRAPFKEIFNQTDMFIYSMMTFVVCMHTSAVAKCGNFGVKRTLVEHFVKFFKADCVEPVPLCLKMIVDCIFHAHPTFKSKAPLTETEVAVIRVPFFIFLYYCFRNYIVFLKTEHSNTVSEVVQKSPDQCPGNAQDLYRNDYMAVFLRKCGRGE